MLAMGRILAAAWAALFLLWCLSWYLTLRRAEELSKALVSSEARAVLIERRLLSPEELRWVRDRIAQERAAEAARMSGHLPPLEGMGMVR